LGYVPSKFADTEELIELIKIIEPYGGIYHAHVRDEGTKLPASIKETIEISEKTGVPSHISHFKLWDKDRTTGEDISQETLKKACLLIEDARSRGLKISADQYPYPFCGAIYLNFISRKAWIGEDFNGVKTGDITNIFNGLRDSELIDLYKKATPYIPLSKNHQQQLDTIPRKYLVRIVAELLIDPSRFQGPSNFRERGLFMKRMANPKEAEKIRQEVMKYVKNLNGPENMLVAICVEKEFEGKSLRQVAEIKKKSVEDTAIELELMGARCSPRLMSEEDIEYIMKQDFVGTGTDGGATPFGIGYPHIRSYASFLNKIKKYALEKQVVSLPHVIRSQTSLPAQIMKLNDRGWIKEGYTADITILDLKNIKIKTSFSNPHQYCEGVKFLIINGNLTIEEGIWNGKLPGKVIKLKK